MAEKSSGTEWPDKRIDAAADLRTRNAEVPGQTDKKELTGDQLLERGKVVAAGVRHRAKTQSALFPRNPLVTVHRTRVLFGVLGRVGPNKNTDEVLAAAVDPSRVAACLENVGADPAE